jgi:hypothetical protein
MAPGVGLLSGLALCSSPTWREERQLVDHLLLPDPHTQYPDLDTHLMTRKKEHPWNTEISN